MAKKRTSAQKVTAKAAPQARASKAKDPAKLVRGELILCRAPGDAKTGRFSGIAAHFEVPNGNGIVWQPGAFKQSVRAGLPVMLWSHDTAEPIGIWTKVEERPLEGLYVEGELNLETQRGREALALLDQGAVTGLSVGAYVDPNDMAFSKPGDTVTVRKASLFEISIVTVPADDDARVRKASAADVRSARDFERFLRASGFPKEAARRLSANGWRALEDKSFRSPKSKRGQSAAASFVAHVRGKTSILQSLCE